MDAPTDATDATDATDRASSRPLAQLRDLARVQVRAGYQDDATIRAEVAEAAREDLPPGRDAATVAAVLVDHAVASLESEQSGWSERTDYDRLEDAFDDLGELGIVVLRAVEDHWQANETLQGLAEAGRRPTGIVFFTNPDVWHAVDHQMLELNVWHGDTANIAAGDRLLDQVLTTLSGHGLPAAFDEGRVEVALRWQRRRLPAGSAPAAQ